MTSLVIVFAPNVGTGGGLVLLRALLNAEWHGAHVTAFLDVRAQDRFAPLPGQIDVHWCASSPQGRWRAERALARLATPAHHVLCFHNLPPVMPILGVVSCYVQNANLVGLIPPSTLTPRLRLRYAVERMIAWTGRHRIHEYFVQTGTMRDALLRWFGEGPPPVTIAPFLPDLAETEMTYAAAPATADHSDQFDYVYVSDGSPNKNHRRLFDAWRLLAQAGHRPRLAVTLHAERDAPLIAELSERVQTDALAITNLGQIPHAEVLAHYRRARALIFPSTAESFGIPLMEAAAAGLPILAPELDYVRDVCAPAVTFDARSSRSIARAVARFEGWPDDAVTPQSAQSLVDRLMHGGVASGLIAADA